MWAGQDDTQRFKTRVLKPPGGGSSDIFGSSSDETSPRRVKSNHNRSQLGTALFGDGASNGDSNIGNTNTENNGQQQRTSNKPGNDSHNRLFGPAPLTNGRLSARRAAYASSTLSLSSESSDSTNCSSLGGKISPRAAKLPPPDNTFNGNSTNTNPITGSGYGDQLDSKAQNGLTSPNSSVTSNSSDKSSNASTPPSRSRVPPGGYSSGLW